MAQNFEKTNKTKSISIPKGKENILLVDDEETILDVGKRALNRLGYKVSVAANGREALKVLSANTNQFDLIITDYAMPHMTGVELAKTVLTTHPGMPIILFTGYSELIRSDEMKKAGIKELISKPTEHRRLGECVRRVLDNANQK